MAEIIIIIIFIVIIIIIIITILLFWDFFIPALVDGFSLEIEW